MQSPQFTLTQDDFKSIGRGALIAVGGALITYLLQVIPNLHMGEWTPVIVAVSAILLNAAKKYLDGPKSN
jgi:hypothetical protein